MIKNAILFDIGLMKSARHIEEYIEEYKSVQPTALETVSTGFTKHPITKEYVSEFEGGFCLTVKTWKKEINKAAFKAKLEDRLERVDHEVTKKEKVDIQDQLLFEILPTILPKPSTVFMYYLHDSKKMIIDTTSDTVAESAISLLRKALGSLSAVPTMFPDEYIMTGELQCCFESDEQSLIDKELNVGESVKLVAGNQKVTIENVDLFEEGVREEVLAYITGGFKPKYIELNYVPNAVTFKLIDGYKLSNLSFDAFEGQGGSPESDWLTESYYMTSVIVNIVGSLNKLQPHTDSDK